jgi:putative endonuclease
MVRVHARPPFDSLRSLMVYDHWKVKRVECPERMQRVERALIMKYSIYILRNPKNKLYIGYTNNINNRLSYHSNGNGAKITRDLKDFQIIYSEQFDNEIDAIRREKQIKKWSRAKKEALISGDINLLKIL